MTKNWTKSSWRDKPILQVPHYPDDGALGDVEEQMASFPPLVFAGEADDLKRRLGDVAKGKAFLLQGGDCAESFHEHSADNIRDFFRVFLQMSAVMTYGAAKPIVKVGRIAGQFAKPRSSDTETIDGVELPSYRGDIINDIEFSKDARIPNPRNQLKAYRQSAATLNLLRAFAQGGFANLNHVHEWTLGFLQNSPQQERYQEIADNISDAIQFMKACGVSPNNTRALKQTSIYTSHEALLLGYEQALTRIDSLSGQHYATSGHLIWIGDRTRQPDHAHVEFCRGIQNPLGIKCGPSLDPDELLQLLDILHPNDDAGRITLICRYGDTEIAKHLPQLIQKVKADGRQVVWSCDPMHGNTIKAVNNYKTRPFGKIMSEVESFFDICNAEGAYPGGIHLEMTGQDVTECTGGAHSISEQDLGNRYHTHCDPRLNGNQALEVAFLIAQNLRQMRSPINLAEVKEVKSI